MKILRVFNIIPVTRVLVKERRNVKHSNSESFIVSEFSSPESRHKRRKTLVESDARKKIWIISGRVKSKGQINGFKINGCGRSKGGEGGKIRHPNLLPLKCFSETLIYFHKSS